MQWYSHNVAASCFLLLAGGTVWGDVAQSQRSQLGMALAAGLAGPSIS